MNGIIAEGYLFATKTLPEHVCSWSGRIWMQISDRESRFYQIFQQHLVEVSASVICYKVYKKPFLKPVIVTVCTAMGTRFVLFLINNYDKDLIKTSKLNNLNEIPGQWAVQIAVLVSAVYLWESYKKVAVIAAIATGVLHCISLVSDDMKARII